jgi:hypothetical protein
MTSVSALSLMDHPLRSDHDAPLDAVLQARSRAVLAWGRLQGRLVRLPDPVAQAFAAHLVRRCLIHALAQSGYRWTETGFAHWFCGLAPAPSHPETDVPALQVAEALLTELMLTAWGPVADVATALRAAGRMDRTGKRLEDSVSPEDALAAARGLCESSPALSASDCPLTTLDHLHGEAAGSVLFSLPERDVFRQGQVFAQRTGPKPPLWALDLHAGAVLAKADKQTFPLPYPGIFSTEALFPHLWPNERTLLVSAAMECLAGQFISDLDSAWQITDHVQHMLSCLRSTSRAPALYRLLAGFGPLRPIQIEKALGASKNGVRELVATLTKANLVTIRRVAGQVLVSAVSSQRQPATATKNMASPDKGDGGNFAVFDAEMLEIDRLLEPYLPGGSQIS